LGDQKLHGKAGDSLFGYVDGCQCRPDHTGHLDIVDGDDGDIVGDAQPAILAVIFSINVGLQIFSEPNVLAVVAPSVVNLHFTPNVYLYNLAFRNAQFNYSAAMAFVLAIVSGVIASFLYLSNRKEAAS
jgi:hypothetical protein